MGIQTVAVGRFIPPYPGLLRKPTGSFKEE